jgi:hypothetical protein
MTPLKSEEYYVLLRNVLERRLSIGQNNRNDRAVSLIEQNTDEFLDKLYEPYILPKFSDEFMDEVIYVKHCDIRFNLVYFYLDENSERKVQLYVPIPTPHPFQGFSLKYPYHKLKKLSFSEELRHELLSYHILSKARTELFEYIDNCQRKFPVFRNFLRYNICFVNYTREFYKARLPVAREQLTPPEIITFLSQLEILCDG